MRRLATLGLGATLLLVVVLAASAVLGLFGGREAPGSAAVEERTGAGVLPDGEVLRVEVLNGSGIPGLARDATRYLRDRSYDVVYYGNAPGEARDTSVVIDRVGRPEDARRVAETLGIDEVRSAPDTTLYLEATVVLGRDWAAERDARTAGPRRGVSGGQ